MSEKDIQFSKQWTFVFKAFYFYYLKIYPRKSAAERDKSFAETTIGD